MQLKTFGGTLLGSVTITVRPPTPTPTNTPVTPTPPNTPIPPTATNTPRPTASLVASPSSISIGGSSTVTARWSPSSLDVHLGIDPDDTAVLGRSSSCSVRSTPPDDDPAGEGVATLTVYGCAEGSGTVELRTYPLGPNSRLLASATITVRRIPPTATNTPVPPTPTDTPVAPTGSVSASATAIDIGGSSTITARWSPSGQAVHLGIVEPTSVLGGSGCSGTSGGRATATQRLIVYGCAEGSGTVELRTLPRGPDSVQLATITITVNTPTPTPTPAPTPAPAPSGWIKASPSKIVVGQTTTITAGWGNLAQDPNIVPSSTALGTSCSGGASTRSVLRPQETQVMTGCSGATVAVTLRNSETDKILATVTVTVVQAPTIDTVTRIGWRWFDIDWSSDNVYVNFEVHWRRYYESQSDWKKLKVGGVKDSRAIFYTQSTRPRTRSPDPGPGLERAVGAQIRGIPHGDAREIYVKVVGITAQGARAESDAKRVDRVGKPNASGHLPDHTMEYTLDGLGTSGLEGWVRNAASASASEWADQMTTLVACKVTDGPPLQTCPRNADGDTVTLTTGGDSCGEGHAACITGPRRYFRVETELKFDRDLNFPLAPNDGETNFEWTPHERLHGDPAPDNKVFIWVKAALVHEFGHAFGMGDLGSGERIMNGVWLLYDGGSRATAGDFATLKTIYKTHNRNHGW